MFHVKHPVAVIHLFHVKRSNGASRPFHVKRVAFKIRRTLSDTFHVKRPVIRPFQIIAIVTPVVEVARLDQRIDDQAAKQFGKKVRALGRHSFAVFADLPNMLKRRGHHQCGQRERLAVGVTGF